jgi:hypothetical protein
VIYQMLHRATSAAVAGERPRLAYFAFTPSPAQRAATADDLLQQLTSLWTRLGSPAGFPFHVVEIALVATPTFAALPSTKGEATDDAVRAALQETAPLFTFGPVAIQRVGSNAPPRSFDPRPTPAATEVIR